MEKLPIGDVIYRLRKEKRITQEQLANFTGVSTAAVSKWESGTSYPDITLLPVLAAFFGVTIDRLLNFKIELSDVEVMNMFSECERLFSSGDLDEAMEKSKEHVSKYPFSYYLKLRIGFLFTMYSWKSSSEEMSVDMIKYSIELYEDVERNCNRTELVEAALFQLGALYPSIGEEDKAVEALNKIKKSQVDPNVLLASIYVQRNELKKARELLQRKLYESINDMDLACLGLANSYMKDEKGLETVERYYNLSFDVKKVLAPYPEGDSVLGLTMEYLNFAQACLQFGETRKAMDMLQNMMEGMRKNDLNKPVEFSSIWCFDEIPDGKRNITMNLFESIFKIFEQPAFDVIREGEEFTSMISELKDLKEKSSNKK